MGRVLARYQAPASYSVEYIDPDFVGGICASCGDDFDRSEDPENTFCEECLEWTSEEGDGDEFFDAGNPFE